MSMDTLVTNLTEAAERYRSAAQEVLDAYRARQPRATDQVTPQQLHEAIQQFLSTSTGLDKLERGSPFQQDVSEIGDYGITLLMDLAAWAGQMELLEPQEGVEEVTIACADWVMRHNGELRTLDPIVNALARVANRTREPHELTVLSDFMGRIIAAASAAIKQDLEKANPGRPWRVLHLNRGIVATRSHNPALMQRVFDELVRDLPDDAAQFFAEGMQQMDALNYPGHVRTVMSGYFDRFTRPTMH